MKTAFYLNVVSPHQMPLAVEVVAVIGVENFRYIYAEDFLADRRAMGWNDGDVPGWCVKGDETSPELVEADIVYTGIRCPSLMKKRAELGKKTVYYSERWFKPIPLGKALLPGKLRMFSPGYRKMAKEMVVLLNGPNMKYLPCGPWAKRDMIGLGVKESQIEPWGYFVEKGSGVRSQESAVSDGALKVLWVGKISWLKRVDTIVKAVMGLQDRVELTIVGDGPTKGEIERLAKGLRVNFVPSQPIEKIREIMRAHDVYVFSSNAMDGWGAVVNEALEEGVYVIGTQETGASAAMLKEEALFSCGDWRRLSRLLAECAVKKRNGVLKGQGIGEWTAKRAAERLLAMVGWER